VTRPTARATAIVATCLGVSVAAMAASVHLWDETGMSPGCGSAGTVCLGAVTTHPHAVASFLLGLAAVAALVAAVAFGLGFGTRRPIVIGGWRHPIDAAGVRFAELPRWRKVALTALAFPLVAWILVVYQVRRLLLGPPAPRR
jgi:hypothetical protein